MQQNRQEDRQHLQENRQEPTLQHRSVRVQQQLEDLQHRAADRHLTARLETVSAEATETVRRATAMDRTVETDRDTTEETVRRVTVTDRVVETDRDTTEETVRRATVTDRTAETDRDTTEETVRRAIVTDRAVETDRDTTAMDRAVAAIVRDITEDRRADVTAVADRAQEAAQAVR